MIESDGAAGKVLIEDSWSQSDSAAGKTLIEDTAGASQTVQQARY